MFFETHVDLRSRSAMQEFLQRHFRYSTGNSWNRSTSYAQCIKMNRLGLNREQFSRGWEILETDFWSEIQYPIEAFTRANRGAWTMRANGRSGGYLVLYQGALEDTGYRSWCPSCGQRNYQPASAGRDRCGVCGDPRLNLAEPLMELRVNARGIDQDEDFSEWEIDRLRDRVRLVRAFDRACDGIRDEFVWLCENAEVVEERVVKTETRKVLRIAA